MQAFLEIDAVEKQIDNFSLGPINVTLEPGTVTALVGDNGSGKSTLLKMMLQLIHPEQGTIQFFGKNIAEDNETWKKDIAYLPQKPLGYEPFTGNALKTFVSYWYPHWDDTLFTRIVRDLNIPLQTNFTKLSPGVQQKLLFALTIARGAKVLLLDEPTTFVDIPAKKYFMDVLVEWLDEGVGNRSIILASHQAEDIQKIADYLLLIQNGKQIGTFEKDQLIDAYKRYWFNDISRLPEAIPGEVDRDAHTILTRNRQETENFLLENDIAWEKSFALDLDEIITLLLQN